MNENLTGLCLQTIVDHFPRFNLAFNYSQDNKVLHNLEFLRRKYSLEILSRLMKTVGFVDETYIDFLVNKHIKLLDYNWFRNCASHEKISSTITKIGSNIEKISLQNDYSDEEIPWQDLIHYLPNLKSFTLQNNCNYLILKKVVKCCPNIEEIDFQNSTIEFEDMENFCRDENGRPFCTKLKKIRCSGSTVSENVVKCFLKYFRSLEEIDYYRLYLLLYKLHESDILSLDTVKPYNITSLDLSYCTSYPFCSDIIKICISVCPRLKRLAFGFNDEDQLNLPNLSELKTLYIRNDGNSEINIDNFLKSKGEKLISLTIINCTFTVPILFTSCPRIKGLVLERVNLIQDDNLKPTFSSLSSCSFNCIDIATNHYGINSFLSSCSNLDSLHFENSNLLSSEIKAHVLKCCECCPMKKISFCGSKIEKEYVKDLLLNCHTLNYLNIIDCFTIVEEDEIIKYAEILPNKPEIHVCKFRRLLND